MPTAIETLLNVAKKWREREPDDAFVQVIDQLIAQGSFDELRGYFEDELHFGTAGLRGAVGWGSGCVNDATVARASWALAQFLLRRAIEGAREPPLVIVGFDARPDSARLAQLAAQVLSGLDLSVCVASEPVPTPLIAFLVRERGAQAGIVITASHNPRGDNGMKVYDEQGVQISSPWDTEIAQFMQEFPVLEAVSRDQENIRILSDQDSRRYLDYVASAAQTYVPDKPSGAFSIAYTPLHGVGGAWVTHALAESATHIKVVCVTEQAQPDGTFPTTPFPNPEEDGALDLLRATALREQCALAFANDPDADRFAACIRDPQGHLMQLSGDALGLLFADVCLSVAKHPEPVLVSTIVSSPALEQLATGRNAQVHRTLTGFKWLCRAALREPQFVFAYEEALGYCFAPPPGQLGVMDKDGIVAAVVLARMLAASGHAQGIFDRLTRLYCELGLWTSLSVSRRFVDDETPPAEAAMAQHMNQLRQEGPKLGDGWELTASQDYSIGAESRPDYLGAQELLSYEFRRDSQHVHEPDYARILIRPSGTEAKLKAYVHLHAAFTGAEPFTSVDQRLQALAKKIGAAALSII